MASESYALAFRDRGSYLNRVHPLVKTACVFLTALALFLYRDPLSGAAVFGALLLSAFVLGRIPPAQVLANGLIIFALGTLLCVVHLFVEKGGGLHRFGPFAFSDQGLRAGPLYFFRLSSVVLASFLLIWTTDTRDLMVALVRAGVPYRIAFAVFLALRFLPLIQREVEAVKAAHAIRGRPARSGLSHRFRLWRRYLFTILVNGLRKAEAVSVSLETRAFGAQPTRSFMRETEFRKDGWLAIAAVLVLAAALWARELLR